MSFYTYMCTINEGHMIYGSWNIRWDRQETSTFWAIFLLFEPLNNLENENFNIEKKPGDIIILYICTINDNHVMYGSWDMECDRQNFFVILDCFLPFYPPNNLESQNFEKLKKKTPGDIIILHKCTKIMITRYTVP